MIIAVLTASIKPFGKSYGFDFIHYGLGKQFALKRVLFIERSTKLLGKITRFCDFRCSLALGTRYFSIQLFL